jgi:hypothetical protein
VIAGTATAVSNRVSRRQANRWAAQETQPAPQEVVYAAPPPQAAPPPTSQDEKINQLKELAALRDAGALTPAEFEVQKEKVLAS